MSAAAIHPRATGRASWAVFAAVAATGAAWLVTVLGILTIGRFVLPLALLGTAGVLVALRRGQLGVPTLAGLLAGVAILPAWFGYLAFGHPGISGDAVSTDGLAGGWWYVAAVVLLVAASMAIFAAARRRS